MRRGEEESVALNRFTSQRVIAFVWGLHLMDAQGLIDSAASVLETARPCAESPAPPVAHHLQPTRSWRGVIGSRSADLADAG